MKNKLLSTLWLFLLLSLLFSSPRAHSRKKVVLAKNLTLSPQNYQEEKPRQDYMSRFISRNTKPLGLKEDLALKKLLSQSNTKWAFRAGERHILD